MPLSFNRIISQEPEDMAGKTRVLADLGFNDSGEPVYVMFKFDHDPTIEDIGYAATVYIRSLEPDTVPDEAI